MFEILIEYIPFAVAFVVLSFFKWLFSRIIFRKKKKNPDDKSIAKYEKKLKKIQARLDKLDVR